jgi:CheY-like chemotaxis protein
MEKPLALIIEDNPQLNTIFSITLQDDFEIVSVSNGDLAFQVLKQLIPSILILDLNLPGVSGQGILEYVRAEERLAAVRVVLATADSAKASELANSADLVLLKPISPTQLRMLASRITRKMTRPLSGPLTKTG